MNYDHKERWEQMHHDLVTLKLGLPCKLEWSRKSKVGSHAWRDDGTCVIKVNPDGDFTQPEHLLLHEAAHHANEPNMDESIHCCGGCLGGHCEHWAQTLCGIYVQTGIALPYSTQFTEFALAAGIVCKKWVPLEERKD